MDVIMFELGINGEHKGCKIVGANKLSTLTEAFAKAKEMFEFEITKEAIKRAYEEYELPKPSGVVYDIMKKEQK